MLMMLTMSAMTFLPNESEIDSQTASSIESGILTAEASAFLRKLAAQFEPRRQELLARRRTIQQEIDSGKLPDFLNDLFRHNIKPG